MSIAHMLAMTLALASADVQEPARVFPPRGEVVRTVQPSAQHQTADLPTMRLERVSAGVPWPRGMAFVDGQLYVLARGRHRSAGGCDPAIEDFSGHIFRVDTEVSEPVEKGISASDLVAANAELFARPDGSIFGLWDRAVAPLDDVQMDRPYCTLAYDPTTQNLFVCGYSGVDLPGRKFRKNGTDSIHRFDLRSGAWYPVEKHDAATIPTSQLSYTTSNEHYPHHDPAKNPAPHGWLNGPDGCTVAGHWLYAVGKDNHSLVQYDLSEVANNPDAGPPESRLVFTEAADLRIDGEIQRFPLMGASAVAVDGDHLYVGFRTSSLVVRFPLTADGDLVRPLVAEPVAQFEPYDAETRSRADLVDIKFNSKGELFVSCANQGRIWKVGRPNPNQIFDGRETPDNPNRPLVDLRDLTDNPEARCGNIVFDSGDRLYLCSGNYDTGTTIAGVIYRAVAVD